MKILSINNSKKTMPETWDELPYRSFTFLAKNFEKLTAADYEFNIRLMLNVVNVRFWEFKLQAAFLNMSNLQILELSKLFSHFLNIEAIILNENKFNDLLIGLKRFIGPAKSLNNISIEEFNYVDLYFRNFLKSGKTEDLNKLCGCLFRKSKPKAWLTDTNYNGDMRQNFNANKISYYAKTFAKVRMWKKHAILLQYWGQRNAFAENFPYIFTPENESKAHGLELGWLGVIFDLSGDKFGTIDKASTMNANLLLLYCQNEIIKNINNKNKQP